MTLMQLDRDDLTWGMDVGVKRHLQAWGNHQKGIPKERAQALYGHVNGALGELAVGRFLGITWPAQIGTYGKTCDYPDQGIEVKTNSWSLCLPISKHQWSAGRFWPFYVVVCGMLTPLNVALWIPGPDVDTHLGAEEKHGLRWVPSGVMRPIHELRGMLRGQS